MFGRGKTLKVIGQTPSAYLTETGQSKIVPFISKLSKWDYMNNASAPWQRQSIVTKKKVVYREQKAFSPAVSPSVKVETTLTDQPGSQSLHFGEQRFLPKRKLSGKNSEDPKTELSFQSGNLSKHAAKPG